MRRPPGRADGLKGLALLAVMSFTQACGGAAVDADGPAAAPDALAAFAGDPPIGDAESWTRRRAPLLRKAFAQSVYGRAPALGPARVVAREEVAVPALGAEIRVEQWALAVDTPGAPAPLNLVLITPRAAQAPVPVIVMQVFCGLRAALPGRPKAVAEPLTPVIWPCTQGWIDPLVSAALGRYTNGPPVGEAIARGYALALFYPGDVVADEKELGLATLARLDPGGPPQARGGAIAAWAQLYSRVYDVLGDDARLDAARIAIWGHSRHGKAALLAGALDPRFAAIIAHQSGRGGAPLTRSAVGETVAQITESYPHWFAPAFAAAAGPDATLPVDQHLLVALNAPRPVLIGAGAQDTWSDPGGGVRAVRGAAPVYALFGARTWQGVGAPDLTAALTRFERPGRHGVTKEDWDFFLAFLDAHLKPAPAP